MRAVPTNEAEAVFSRLWDRLRSDISEWTVGGTDGTGTRFVHAGNRAAVHWDRGGGCVARLRRSPDLALEDYDHVHLCISLATTTQMTIRVCVDGKESTPISGARGTNVFEEYEGPVAGSRLEWLEIELEDESPRPGMAQVSWVGVLNAARRDRRRTRTGLDRDAFADLVKPLGETVSPAPTLGLFFGEDDLDALRRKVARAPYARVMAALREEARGYIGSRPWLGVGTHPNPFNPRCGRMEPRLEVDPLACRICSFVGLVDRDEELCRVAIDHALALAHCDWWVNDMLDTFPGTTWQRPAFFHYRMGTNVAFAWDWAGSYLTEAGKAVIAQALLLKAMPGFYATFARYPYVRTNNQGAYMSYGAIICMLALSHMWPLVTEPLETVVGWLDETMENYIGEDGGAHEGPGYVTSTLGHALVAYRAVARHRGVRLEEVAHPRLLKAADFVMAILSTCEPPGSTIHVTDGGRPGATIYRECLAGLVELSPGHPIAVLMANMLETGSVRETHATPGSVFNLVFGPETFPEGRAMPPVFRILEDVGMLCSCRPTPHGPVRLQCIGGKPGAGHGHEDKGSFVLEAFGEEIAIDPGQLRYSDARMRTISFAQYHNLLAPDGRDGLPAHQLNPYRDGACPEGQGDERTLHAAISADGVYGDVVTRWRRCIDSDEPTVFVVTDEMDLAEDGHVSFHLQSRFPWVRVEVGWETAGERAVLTVEPQWVRTLEEQETEMVDGAENTLYHLRLRSEAGKVHRLVTGLSVRPSLV